MFDDRVRKFTFRCENCRKLMVSEFEDEKDIEDITEDLLWLQCPTCDVKAPLLRD